MLEVIEVLAEANKSRWGAALAAVTAAAKTVRHIKSISIENLQATVTDGKITPCRINAKLSFVLE